MPSPALTPEQHNGLVAIVRAASRDCIMPRFRRLGLADVAAKSGPTDLVTLADTEAEAQITAAVQALLPHAVVVGEEAIAATPHLRDAIATAPLAVIIDPVDGTWNFAKGLPLFGVILAVTVMGKPVFGLLHDPVMDDWIVADGTGSTARVMADGTRAVLATSQETGFGGMAGYVPLGLVARRHRAALAAAMAEFGRAQSLRCSCHEYRMVAQGHAAFLLSGAVPHAWDHAAGVLCVQRAGGVVRMLDGAAYHAGMTQGHVLAAGSQALWDALAARFAFLLDD